MFVTVFRFEECWEEEEQLAGEYKEPPPPPTLKTELVTFSEMLQFFGDSWNVEGDAWVQVFGALQFPERVYELDAMLMSPGIEQGPADHHP